MRTVRVLQRSYVRFTERVLSKYNLYAITQAYGVRPYGNEFIKDIWSRRSGISIKEDVDKFHINIMVLLKC